MSRAYSTATRARARTAARSDLATQRVLRAVTAGARAASATHNLLQGLGRAIGGILGGISSRRQRRAEEPEIQPEPEGGGASPPQPPRPPGAPAAAPGVPPPPPPGGNRPVAAPPSSPPATVREPNWSGRSILEPPRPGEERSLSPEHRTPASSNVYSFQYDYASSTLYVRFLAPALNTSAVYNSGRGGGIKSHHGGVITGKSNKPGPLYAYLDVPVRVFKRMVTAKSAGKAVWDELRIRGTIWGHQYRYILLQGSVVAGEGGRLGVYVPRRATVRGFRKRAVPTAGTGRRQWTESTIPETINRGRPNRGAPDRGLPSTG